LNPEDPKADNPAPEQTEAAGPNPEIDAFFQRLPGNLHWPAPSEAAIAAAVETIQRISGAASDHARRQAAGEESGSVCGACGQSLRNGNRFCGNCGVPVAEVASAANEPTGSPASGAASETAVPPNSAQHHYHHHYHHFVGTPGSAPASAQQETGVVHGKASSVSGTGSRAGLLARQVAQDWAQACNTKHLDDLLELYVSDATLIRSNVPPVRSTPAIREFLFASLEAGLGDVEMESLRTEIFGEIALDLGRCKMLIPVAMGKRREERGKYLLVMARQPAGHWKIIADCWSIDLSVSANTPETARKPNDPGGKKPRQP
jgi:ketosteroid isomerase-like protein